jgi:hypothetical protein
VDSKAKRKKIKKEKKRGKMISFWGRERNKTSFETVSNPAVST